MMIHTDDDSKKPEGLFIYKPKEKENA
jgi:hypothetical protein